MNPYITSKAGKRWSAGEKYSFPENVTGRTFESFILKDILLQPPSNLLAPLKRVYLKKGDVIFVSTSPDPGINKVQVCSGRGRHKSAVLSLYGWVIAPIFLPYNNDLHDRPVTVDEVTGRGFKATVHMVKDNKYSHDKMRVEMTDGTRYFFFPPLFLNAMCVFYQIPPSLKRVTGESKRGSIVAQGGKKEEKVELLSLTGLFHNH